MPAAATVSMTAVKRPLLIDERDGRCDLCASHVRGECDECHERIPVYPEMGGSGFLGPDEDHFHIVVTSGISGREAFALERCKECYEAKWAELHPGLPGPFADSAKPARAAL